MDYKSATIGGGALFRHYEEEHESIIGNIFLRFTANDDEETWNVLVKTMNDEYPTFDDSTAIAVMRNCFSVLQNNPNIAHRCDVLSVFSYAFQFANSPIDIFEELRIGSFFKSQLNERAELQWVQIILNIIECFIEKINTNTKIGWFGDVFDILINFSASKDPIFSQLRSSFLDLSSILLKRFNFDENYAKQLFLFFTNNFDSYNYNFDLIYIFRILEYLLTSYSSLYELFVGSQFFDFVYAQLSSQNDPLICCSLKMFLPILKNDRVIDYFIRNNFINLVKNKFGFFNYKVKLYMIKCINELVENSNDILKQVVDYNLLKCADLFSNNFKLQSQTMLLIHKILLKNFFPNDEYIYNYTINNSISFLSSDDQNLIILSLNILIMLHSKVHPIPNDTRSIISEYIENLFYDENDTIQKSKKYLNKLIN